MKKQIFRKNRAGIEEMQDVNLSANRICLDFIKKNIGKRKFFIEEIEKGLEIKRTQATNWVNSLRKNKDLNSKKINEGELKGRRWFQLNSKGQKRIPNKKGIKKEPRIIEKEVPMEIEKKYLDRIIPIKRI